MENTELCAALFEALAAGDDARVRTLCTPDMQAIQNRNPPMNLDALLQFSSAVHGVVENFRYEEAVRSATATGFVEEHSVRGELPDGKSLDLRVCVVADVRDGKICSLREYLDTAAARGLAAALS